MRELPPELPGVYTATCTRLGRFAGVNGLRDGVRDSFYGHYTRAIGSRGMIFGRAAGLSGGDAAARTLATLPAPSALRNADDALAYADLVHQHLHQLDRDLCVSLALLSFTDRGLCGWVCGGAWVFAITDTAVLCSPDQRLLAPPELALPPGLLKSGITREGIQGGDWFSTDGNRFAVALSHPLLDLSALHELDHVVPFHLLQLLGCQVAAQCTASAALLAVLERDASDRPVPVTTWLASADRVDRFPIASRWSDLCASPRGLPAFHLDELDGAAAILAEEPTSRRWVGSTLASHGVHAAAAAALSDPRTVRAILCEHAPFHSLFAAHLAHPTVHDADARGALAYWLTAQATGAGDIAGFSPAAWLQVLATDPRRSESDSGLGLLSLVLARPDLLPAFVFAEPTSFQPGLSFGFNGPAFVAYLAAGLSAQAGRWAIEAAWDAFLRGFPSKLAAQTLHWPDLLAAAAVVHHCFAGIPLSDVAACLANDIRRLSWTPDQGGAPPLTTVPIEGVFHAGDDAADPAVDDAARFRGPVRVRVRVHFTPAHSAPGVYCSMSTTHGPPSGKQAALAALQSCLGEPLDGPGWFALIVDVDSQPTEAPPSAFRAAALSAAQRLFGGAPRTT